MTEGELPHVSCGEGLRMEQMAARIKDPVGLNPPAQERGAPWRQQVGPRETERDEAHAEPEHTTIPGTFLFCHQMTVAK